MASFDALLSSLRSAPEHSEGDWARKVLSFDRQPIPDSTVAQSSGHLEGQMQPILAAAVTRQLRCVGPARQSAHVCRADAAFRPGGRAARAPGKGDLCPPWAWQCIPSLIVPRSLRLSCLSCFIPASPRLGFAKGHRNCQRGPEQQHLKRHAPTAAPRRRPLLPRERPHYH